MVNDSTNSPTAHLYFVCKHGTSFVVFSDDELCCQEDNNKLFILLFIVCYAKLLIGSSLISLQLVSPSTSASTEAANPDDTAIQLLPQADCCLICLRFECVNAREREIVWLVVTRCLFCQRHFLLIFVCFSLCAVLLSSINRRLPNNTTAQQRRTVIGLVVLDSSKHFPPDEQQIFDLALKRRESVDVT